MSRKIDFYCAWYCPFAQRTWIALEHLALTYNYRETDPYNKTERWLKLSRGTGQVPALRITAPLEDPLAIPDSLRTLEYLDERPSSASPLYPITERDRVDTRFWLDRQGNSIIAYFYRLLKAQSGSVTAITAEQKMLAGVKEFSQGMSNSAPFFFGAQPTAVDFAFAPFALRIEILLAHYQGFQLPTTGKDWSRYHIWWQAVKVLPAFVATMPELDTYRKRLLEFYYPYSIGGGQEDVTKIT